MCLQELMVYVVLNKMIKDFFKDFFSAQFVNIKTLKKMVLLLLS